MSESRPSCAEGVAWMVQRLADRLAAGRRQPADRVADSVAPPEPAGRR